LVKLLLTLSSLMSVPLVLSGRVHSASPIGES